MKNGLKNLFLVLVVIVSTLIALEFFAQFLIAKKVLPPILIGPFETYRFDPKLGWAIEPNMEEVHKTLEFEYPVKNNSFGMRYREFSKEKNFDIYRVAVVGDSFSWGHGVMASERFTEKTEELTGHKVEMLNFGVAGYGPIQYYLKLDEVIKYNPEMVLIAFYLENDFMDNVFWCRVNRYKPYAEINDMGSLEIQGYPLPNRFVWFNNGPQKRLTWLEKKSFIAYRLRLLLGEFSGKTFDKFEQKGLLGTRISDFYLETGRIELANKAIATNTLILEKIKKKLETNGIKLTVLVIPSKIEYGVAYNQKWSSDKKKNLKLHTAFMTTLEKLNIDHIELIDDITPEDFWEQDGHWRASGHEKAARKIAEFLTDQEIIK